MKYAVEARIFNNGKIVAKVRPAVRQIAVIFGWISLRQKGKPGSLLLDTGKRELMKKTERLELENKILRDMLSDIQISIQKFEEDTATGERKVLNAFKTLGSIAYIAGNFSDRVLAEKCCSGATGGGQT